jgi:hypothetical protein
MATGDVTAEDVADGGERAFAVAITRDDPRTAASREPMIGDPVEASLATECEHRIGERVLAASTLHVRRAVSPDGRVTPRKREPTVMALTESDVWFLEWQYRLFGAKVGAVLCSWPRRAAVASWDHRWWAWPSVWRLELSWPAQAYYIEGEMIAGADAERMIGLMTHDDLARAPAPRIPTPG